MSAIARSAVNLERHLHRNGTRIVKFFLHLSKEEQCKRFLARIDEPEKNWKFSLADVEERKFWTEYRTAYEDCLSATSTEDAPWHVVPADDKLNARLIVSKIILDTFKEMKMTYPKTTAERRKELQAIREQLSVNGLSTNMKRFSNVMPASALRDAHNFRGPHRPVVFKRLRRCSTAFRPFG